MPTSFKIIKLTCPTLHFGIIIQREMLGSSCIFCKTEKEVITVTENVTKSYSRLSILPCGEMAYPEYIEVERFLTKVPFKDNLKPMQVDRFTGTYFKSRGIAKINNKFFLDMKVESYDGYIETKIISAFDAAELIIKHQKYEVIDEIEVQKEAMTILSGF